jgi:hypothetical protein
MAAMAATAHQYAGIHLFVKYAHLEAETPSGSWDSDLEWICNAVRPGGTYRHYFTGKGQGVEYIRVSEVDGTHSLTLTMREVRSLAQKYRERGN